MLGNQLFGTYSPGSSLVHRCPLWIKGLFVLAATLWLALTQGWLAGFIAIILAGTLCYIAGLRVRDFWSMFRSLFWIIILLSIYYLVTRNFAQGFEVLSTMIAFILLSRAILVSTPMPRLIDGFIWLCSPLKLLGINTQNIGLAIALMLRSIPVIMNEFSLLQQAASSRGSKIPTHKLFTPLVISTVAYAQETGDALVARGLDE